jgi:hypothetical protein
MDLAVLKKHHDLAPRDTLKETTNKHTTTEARLYYLIEI